MKLEVTRSWFLVQRHFGCQIIPRLAQAVTFRTDTLPVISAFRGSVRLDRRPLRAIYLRADSSTVPSAFIGWSRGRKVFPLVEGASAYGH